MDHAHDASVQIRAAALMFQLPDDEAAPEVVEISSLVQRTLAGDSTAFEQIVARTERRVLTLAWRLLGNRHDAQDAAQDVFLRAFKYIHRFDVRQPLEPWLMRMTVNVCRDLGRKRRRACQVDSETEEMLSKTHQGTLRDPHSDLEIAQQKQVLRIAIGRLPEKERIALVLRDIEGLSTTEVASILKSTESTVRSQVSTGRMKLKRIIESMNLDRS